jgi:hypothetical protein
MFVRTQKTKDLSKFNPTLAEGWLFRRSVAKADLKTGFKPPRVD